MPEEKTKRTTTKRSINLYWTDEQQKRLETVGEKLTRMGVPGITKRNGEYNISAIVNYLLEQATAE